MWGIRRAGLLSCLAVAAGLGLAPSVAAEAARPSLVRLGGTPLAAADAPPVGAVGPGTVIHLTVVLKPRNGLAGFVQRVSDPSSPFYRAYLTPTQFAQRFGATQAQLDAVEASLRAHGLSPGAVSANRLSISLTANAGSVQRAFSLSLRRVRLVSGRVAVVPSVAPAVDSSVAGDLQAILGLSSVSAPRPLSAPRLLRGRTRGAHPRAVRHVATGGPQPCSDATSTASANGAYTADQIASAYRFPGLYGAGDQGQGQTIAMYELEPDDPQDIAAYQACYGTSTSVSYVPVDGGAGSGAGSGEAALDIEVAIGLAPKATILVYQGPNSDQGTPGSGPYDTYSAIINQDRAQVISTSWGTCEPDNGMQAGNAENTLFEQAAVQGQSIFAAAGDTGSEDCFGDTPPNLSLAVDDPGSQPNVTSVGGTTMSRLGPPPAETVWNNGGNVALAAQGAGAGGGGISQMWKMPAYQTGADGFLNVISSNSSGSPCGASSGLCREVPDVAADADPSTGYVIYWNGSNSDPTMASGWQPVGGTSAAAPLWASLTALANGSAACHGSPIGFANPTLYAVAGTSYGADFNDITSGNNDDTGSNGGLYPAGAGFDMATGLGTPSAATLASSLCGTAFRITNPGRRVSTVGQSVSLQLSTSGDRGSGVGYAADGLPPGLSLDASTGRITGKPSRSGTYIVAVGAVSRDDATRGTDFTWQVLKGPTVSGTALSGLRSSSPRLQLTVAAANGAPGLTSVTVNPGRAVRFAPGKGQITVRGPSGQKLAFKLHVKAGQLQVVLRAPRGRISISIGSGALVPSATTRSRARHGQAVSVSFTLVLTDASGLHTTVTVRVKSRH